MAAKKGIIFRVGERKRMVIPLKTEEQEEQAPINPEVRDELEKLIPELFVIDPQREHQQE